MKINRSMTLTLAFILSAAFAASGEQPVKIEALATQTATPQTVSPTVTLGFAPAKMAPALPAQPRSIKVAQSGDLLWYLPLYVAIDQGLFLKEGLDVTLTNTGDDAGTLAAVAKGNVQFGIADPTVAAMDRGHGPAQRVIAGMVDGAALFGVTMNPKVAAINNPRELKNYSVGTLPQSTASYDLQKQMFKDGHLKPNIHPVPIGNLLIDLEAGRSDIALASEPNVTIALQKGGRIVYSMPDQYADFAMAGVLVADDTLRKNPEIAQEFVSAIAEAQRLIYADPDMAANVAARRFPALTREIALAAVQNMIKNKTVPASPVISAEAWKNACQLRSNAGELGSMEHIMDLVENKYALKAVVQTTP